MVNTELKESNPQPKSSKASNRFSWLWTDYSVIIAFIIIFIAASIMSPRFLDINNQMNILMQVSIIGIISLGMTVVMLSGGIDLSVGSVLVLVGVISVLALNASGSIFVAILTACIVGSFAGFLNGLMVAKGRIASFIATLGMMAAARSIALYIANGGSISGKVSGFTAIANSDLWIIDYPIIIFLVMTVLVYVLMHKTRFGRYVYAIGSNEKAATLSAIRVDRVKLAVYSLVGLLVSVAAVIETSRLNSISSSSSGVSYELDAIAAVIIGGTRMTGGKGKILGTFFGVLILGILNNMMNLMNVSPHLQGFVKGLIIIVAVVFQKRE
ncbi:ABC transporter permease [Heyndrickxia oleronia]|jgi:ribose transport system permease protein|uniref:Ribose ABC transporter permease n=1 Tax=Heyndrickxia oleronia TaxID=38875 RepID=A0A8E2IDE4_9BACI|nr:ABC transporter permease [Heyndrickxia oleronia]NYV65722.1 ABC transporter permease [Bacillus sp. Gen3]MBU5211625.1 ABC transporter permease [Heyndrickxia oleronia]MCI1588987.1 ABC transporter permease [Heyndrickxia oleronia]MCI1611921.1 ABC transporter permease [Heyndrickxia oleronia]MCI1743072.1 ABC transporter permease [Heyndrickxia oleronia]